MPDSFNEKKKYGFHIVFNKKNPEHEIVANYLNGFPQGQKRNIIADGVILYMEQEARKKREQIMLHNQRQQKIKNLEEMYEYLIKDTAIEPEVFNIENDQQPLLEPHINDTAKVQHSVLHDKTHVFSEETDDDQEKRRIRLLAEELD